MLFLALPGIFEFWPILIVVIVLFGAKKLPELARAMGSSVNQFKKGLGEEGEAPEKLTDGSAEKSEETKGSAEKTDKSAS